MGGDEPFLGPLALFGGIGLATGVLVTAGVTLFVFRDISSPELRSATPTPRSAGITLLREFGGPAGTPTPQLGVATGPQANETRPPLGAALAALSEQEAAQRPPAEAPAPVAQAAPAAVPARQAPAAQLAPYSAPATYFEPPPAPRPTDTPRPAPTEAPRPTPTPEEVRAAREPGPVSSPPSAASTPAPSRPTPPIARPTPPIVPQPGGPPAGGAGAGSSGSSAVAGSSGGTLPITVVVTTPTRTAR